MEYEPHTDFQHNEPEATRRLTIPIHIRRNDRMQQFTGRNVLITTDGLLKLTDCWPAIVDVMYPNVQTIASRPFAIAKRDIV